MRRRSALLGLARSCLDGLLRREAVLCAPLHDVSEYDLVIIGTLRESHVTRRLGRRLARRASRWQLLRRHRSRVRQRQVVLALLAAMRTRPLPDGCRRARPCNGRASLVVRVGNSELAQSLRMHRAACSLRAHFASVTQLPAAQIRRAVSLREHGENVAPW